MKIENVLELEYMPVFDSKFIVRIKYQNTDVLKRGEFIDEEIGVMSTTMPNFTTIVAENGALYMEDSILYIMGTSRHKDSIYNIVSRKMLDEIIRRVKLINKKHGIKVRERAQQGEMYYFISSIGDIRYTYDTRSNIDNSMLKIGNYFYTEEDAENSEIYKGFQKQKEDLKGESRS